MLQPGVIQECPSSLPFLRQNLSGPPDGNPRLWNLGCDVGLSRNVISALTTTTCLGVTLTSASASASCGRPAILDG